MADVNERLRIVQSWWVGSELVRRHPELRLIETHPGGGMYDCLTVIRTDRTGPATLIDLNRNGSMHVPAAGILNFMSWEEERELGDRHGAVKRLEIAAGLTAPETTPASTPAVLTYRATASILTGLLNEREPWDVRNQMLDTSDGDSGPRYDLSSFPTAKEYVRERRPDDIHGCSEYRFWVLTQGGKPRAVLDHDGSVHTAHGHSSLSGAYVRHGRRLHPAIAATLGGVLP